MSHVATHPSLSAFAEHTRCPDVFLDAADTGAASIAPDMTTTVEDMRRERYLDNRLAADTDFGFKTVARQAYYAVRPLLPVAVRKHAQRWALRDWQTLRFPAWPVDVTVERLMNDVFDQLLTIRAVDEIPFIWFWPDGHEAAALMTHDVETTAGRDFCGMLMKLEAERAVRSSFEVVPEERYGVPETFLDEIRSGGCEVCVHDLNHDGRLFLHEAVFRDRVKKINAYAQRFRATGFRSAVMYRRVDWFDGFQFSYDMSLPNVAHLDPQRGGCCTVMPYFIGDLVELPLTTTQDYQLFHILRRHDLDLWKHQADIVLSHHGLLSFIVHPDYMLAPRALDLYGRLLDYLADLRDNRRVWVALPGDIDRWWRQRRDLRLDRCGDRWRVVGNGAERARVAFARRDDGRISYRLEHAA